LEDKGPTISPPHCIEGLGFLAWIVICVTCVGGRENYVSPLLYFQSRLTSMVILLRVVGGGIGGASRAKNALFEF